MLDRYECVIIGGGPAGLSAALSARESGLERILIVERDLELGGILNQCIHNGFGLHYFKEELTGPEYAGRLIDQVMDSDIQVACDTMVLSLDSHGGGHRVTLMSAGQGYRTLESQAVILAMGCRERTRGAIQTPGSRVAGILTAGTAQRYVNMEGYMVGRRVMILGSGDIGLIMARRMTLEGAQVVACVEIMPYPGGLTRNIVQCLDDFDIPLLLSHTITRIHGKGRLDRVTVQAVDQTFQPLAGTEVDYEIDCLLLSVGLIPENELSRAAGLAMDPRTGGPLVFENKETSEPGIFACGNVLQVHDLVDYVTEESQEAGRAAAAYVLAAKRKDQATEKVAMSLVAGQGISYVIPQQIRLDRMEDKVRLFFRVKEPHKSPRRILVSHAEEQIAAFRRPFLSPGEMEHIYLTKEDLDKVGGGQLTLSIED